MGKGLIDFPTSGPKTQSNEKAPVNNTRIV